MTKKIVKKKSCKSGCDCCCGRKPSNKNKSSKVAKLKKIAKSSKKKPVKKKANKKR